MAESPQNHDQRGSANLQRTRLEEDIANAVIQFPTHLRRAEDESNPAPFAILKSAGEGSTGHAFLVQDCRFPSAEKKHLIAKVTDLSKHKMGKSVADQRKMLEHARSEIACLRDCDHFAIIHYVDSAETPDGDFFLLITEYADAGDLGRVVKSRARNESYFKEHEVGFIFLDIVLAVDYLHKKNVLHRDIKSANIFLSTTGITKLGDFGYSHQYDHSVSEVIAGTVCGTPFYLAPEIWNRHPYSNRADMWCLGVILYEIAALRRPFNGKDQREVMQKVLVCQPEPLPNIYSPQLQEIVHRLLILEPAYRFNTQQILDLPYMRQVTQMFESVIEKHQNFSPETKERILRQVAEAKPPAPVPYSPTVRQQQQNLPPPQMASPQSGGGDELDIPNVENLDLQEEPNNRKIFVSGVMKYCSRGWRGRILILCQNSITVATRTGDSSSLDLSKIRMVCTVDPHQVDGRQGVFLLDTSEGQVCFQAATIPERFQWISVIQSTLESFRACHPDAMEDQ